MIILCAIGQAPDIQHCALLSQIVALVEVCKLCCGWLWEYVTWKSFWLLLRYKTLSSPARMLPSCDYFNISYCML